MIDSAFAELVPATSVTAACRLLGKSKASHYRRQHPKQPRPSTPRPTPPNALTEAERAAVLAVLTSPRFVDRSVAHTWATLLDEGVYLASMATMHRVLRAAGQAGERRRQATHPPRQRPELVASRPGEVWSWDITKLAGPRRGSWFDLYVILDIFSRYVVGWTVAAAESGELAAALIADAITRHGEPKAIHADRGTSMTSKPVTQLLLDLGVARSHSRPHVSNDNPYSEAAFKTLKYAPVFPASFGSIADARTFCATFFSYYNAAHRHSALGLHTPASIHYGTAAGIQGRRAGTLRAAYQANPIRFGRRVPRPPSLPSAAWINQPTPEALIQTN